MSNAASPPPAAPPARRGMRGSARSMVISMLVILAGCAVWIAIVPRVSTTAQPVENVPSIAREVGQGQGWNVALADGLGEQWTPINVRLIRLEGQPPAWHLGYRAPSEDFVSVDQTKDGSAAWVQKQTGTSSTSGRVTVAGAAWDRYVKGDRRSLVRTEPLSGLKTVVGGEASWAEIERLAGSLRPTQRGA